MTTINETRGTAASCHVCENDFAVRFRYQVREEASGFVYLCSTQCQREHLIGPKAPNCTTCGNEFEVEYAYQVVTSDDQRAYFCSMDCRTTHGEQLTRATDTRAPRRIAVFNHKGGTGKTTTAINIAAGLAETGRRVLLVDCDGQGNVGASLGIRGEKTLYHVLVQGTAVEEAVVTVRQNLDIITSNETLAAAELHLATQPARHRILRERLGSRVHGYDVVVLDCAPALSLMNQNALVYADGVVVPVSCDYLSLVGVRQVLRTLGDVKRILKHDVEIMGVVPTFYDVRNRISRDALTALQKHFKDKCALPVRVNTKLREAPSAKQTIFEYAPGSNGAKDYLALVERLLPTTGQVFGDQAKVQATFARGSVAPQPMPRSA